jgi:hypothetical protein
MPERNWYSPCTVLWFVDVLSNVPTDHPLSINAPHYSFDEDPGAINKDYCSKC